MQTNTGVSPGTEKRALYGKAELTRLINPASVAVIGASPTPGSFGLNTLRQIEGGYKGGVYPINPKYPTILNHACYPSLKDTPTIPDCVVLTIPKNHVEKSLETCAELGVGGVVIYSSGFAELGTAEGIRQQQNMTAIARQSGLRICGPNCIGIINVASRLGLSFMTPLPMVDGTVGVVSQSGALGYILMQAMERGLGFSHYLSPGNSCDVDVCDFVNYLIEDDKTKSIVCTLEGIRDGARFVEVCRRALVANKPLIVCKMGNSEISKRTALSHTGTLAGTNAAYQAVFDQMGVIVVEDFEAILETASFFSKVGRPTTKGIGVMASSGGAAVMAADRAAERGVELPPPALRTSEKLKEVVPEFGSVQNPADITAESLKSAQMYGHCITAFADDPSFGAVVVPMISAFAPTTVDRAQYLCDLAKDLKKPVCVVWLNEWYEGPGSEVYDSSENVCMFRSMARCFTTLKSWLTRDERREQLLKSLSARQTGKSHGDAARAVLNASRNRGAMTERESKQILTAYGLRVTREALAHDADAAVMHAARIGYPVVMKAESADIPHKTEAGVVKLSLKSESEVRAAYADIMAAIACLPGKPVVDGVVVQEMVKPGVEVMIGVRQDPQFGTLVLCGLGGIFVELLKDVAVALAPIDRQRARAMIESLKGYPLLSGFRGSRPVNVDALADMMCRLSELGVDLAAEIGEIDVNPVILDAKDGIAVDALVIRRAADIGGAA